MVNAVSSINAQPMYVVLTNGAVAAAAASVAQLEQATPLMMNPGVAMAPVAVAPQASVSFSTARSAYQAAAQVTAQLTSASVSFAASLAA